jgi:UDP-N-acetylmuramate dehydrogenase
LPIVTAPNTASVLTAGLTTLRLGGPAARFVDARSAEEVVAALRDARDDVLLVGGGSNLVIADDGWPGTVVRVGSTGHTVERDGASALVTAEAGTEWDALVAATVAEGLGGLECLSGIPGSTGATPVQNVGAYGTEVSDTITRVRLLDRRSGAVSWVPAADLRFGYRTSALKGADARAAVVLEVEFALDGSGRSAPLRYGELTSALGVASGDRVDPATVRAAVLRLRRRKGMVLDADDHDTWSVGSFFTNPVVADQVYQELADRVDGPVPHFPAAEGVKLAAAWLVDHAGFSKGYPGSDAAACRLSTKHALALTNRGGATTADVLALARTVRDGVRDVFGITLEAEPVLVGCCL